MEKLSQVQLEENKASSPSKLEENSTFSPPSEENETFSVESKTIPSDDISKYPRLGLIIYLKLMGDDSYTTFKAIYAGKNVVVKFFTQKSDKNNEYEILEYLREHSTRRDLFPKPYFYYDLNDETYEINYLQFGLTDKYTKDQLKDTYSEQMETVGVKSIILTKIYKVIVYEYIEGEIIREISYNKNRLKKDIKEILKEFHRLGFVHADLNSNNILRTGMDRYLLIDFGSAFSVTDKRFPPLQFMIEEGEIPTQKDDYDGLSIHLA